MFTGQLVIVVTYLVLTFSAIGISFTVILPFLRSLLTHWGGNVVGGLLTFFGISVFLRPIVMKKIHAQQVKQWRLNGAKRSLLFFYLNKRGRKSNRNLRQFTQLCPPEVTL